MVRQGHRIIKTRKKGVFGSPDDGSVTGGSPDDGSVTGGSPDDVFNFSIFDQGEKLNFCSQFGRMYVYLYVNTCKYLIMNLKNILNQNMNTSIPL